jgi:hypothetical protein
MKTQTKVLLFPLFIVGIFLLPSVSRVEASCIIPLPTFIIAYQDGVYIDGFSISNTGSSRYGYCNNYPVVSDNMETEGVFPPSSQATGPELTTGVYLLGEPSKKISDDINYLYEYRSKAELVEKTENYLRKPIISIFIFLILFIIFILTIYVLWKTKKQLIGFKEKRNLYLKIILSQISLILFLWLFVWWSIDPLYINSFSGPVLLPTVIIYTALFTLAILIELIYLVTIKIKPSHEINSQV